MIDTTTHGQTLLVAAREHAEDSFRILLSPNPTPFELRSAAIHAGAAAEFLAKARAWTINPLLVLIITGDTQRKSFAAKQGRLDDEDLNEIHTLNASDVVEIAAAAARIELKTVRADQVLSARNQAAHMAISPTNPHHLADDIAQVIRCFLPTPYTIDLDDFPNRESFLVNDDLASEVSGLHGLVYEEIRTLVNEAKDKFARMSSSAKGGVEGFRSAQEKRSLDHIQGIERNSVIEPDMTTCPACGYMASAWFTRDEVLLDDYGNFGANAERVFSCGVCGLLLDPRQTRAWIERDKPLLTENPQSVSPYVEMMRNRGNFAEEAEYATGVHMDTLEDE